MAFDHETNTSETFVADLQAVARKKAEAILEETRRNLQLMTMELMRTQEEMKKLNQALELKNAELKALSDKKSEFMSVVSHELRTPLAVTNQGIALVLDGLAGKVTEKQKKFLLMAQKNINRLARIINDLLDISKIESGKFDLAKAPVEMGELANFVADFFRQKAAAKGLVLRVVVPSGPLTLDIDHDKISQVMINLVGNALKFTEKGFVEVTIEEAVDKVTVSVSDSGPGIAPEHLGNMFDKFYQGARIPGATEKGTGLGLSISKSLVELHGGRIWMESCLGKGTKVFFTLPKK